MAEFQRAWNDVTSDAETPGVKVLNLAVAPPFADNPDTESEPSAAHILRQVIDYTTTPPTLRVCIV